jgi:hypothetical protein
MDERLAKALDFSKFRQTLTLERKNLKEKIDANLTYGYNGGIFKIDRSLIVFVQMLIDQQRTENVPLLDSNDTPILISDLNTFKDEILDRYMTAVYEYFRQYEKIKKSRSVDKLIEL